MRIRLSVIAAIVMMTAGCVSEKDASDVILFVEPSAYTAVSGDAIYYDITSWTIHESLAEITFTTFDSSRGEQLVHTEQVGTKRYSGSFTYEVPSIDADSLVFDSHHKVHAAADSRGRRVLRTGLRIQEITHIGHGTGHQFNMVTHAKPRESGQDPNVFAKRRFVRRQSGKGVGQKTHDQSARNQVSLTGVADEIFAVKRHDAFFIANRNRLRGFVEKHSDSFHIIGGQRAKPTFRHQQAFA